MRLSDEIEESLNEMLNPIKKLKLKLEQKVFFIKYKHGVAKEGIDFWDVDDHPKGLNEPICQACWKSQMPYCTPKPCKIISGNDWITQVELPKAAQIIQKGMRLIFNET